MHKPITRPLRARRWMGAFISALWALSPNAHAGDDMWPCEVALCMANPKGPAALAECKPAIEKAWKAWAKGKHVPPCKKKSAEGEDQGALTKQEGHIDQQAADPMSNCPYTYYATRQKTKYCAFTGVTNQYVNGQLWGRIWYGGPGGEPFIEMLHNDPADPRPPEKFPGIWAPLKADIEAKADLAAVTYTAWTAAESTAVTAEKKAAKAWDEANDYAQKVAQIEAELPGKIQNAVDQIAQAEADLQAAYPLLVAAEEAAKQPGASPAALAHLDQVRAQVYQILSFKSAADTKLNGLLATQAKLPAMHAKAQQLAEVAAAAQAVANDKRSLAQQAKATSDAAQAAAKPLPPPFG